MARIGKVVSALSLPKRKEDDMADGETKTPTNNLVEQMKRDANEVALYKNYQKLMWGDNPPTPPPPTPTPTTPNSKENIAMNVADMIKAIGDIMPKKGGDDVLTTFLLARQDKLETLLQAMAGGKMTPQEALKQQLEITKQIDEEYKHRVGIGTTGVTSVPELKVMAEIEQMKADREDRKLQHEAEMKRLDHQHENEAKERQRRWDIDDKKWDAEFGLKVKQLEVEDKGSDKKMAVFENIAASVLNSLEPAGPTSEQIPPQAKGSESPRSGKPNIPVSFICGECGTTVPVEPGSLKATCPNPDCQTVYEMRPAP
jgi:hypothetical protein